MGALSRDNGGGRDNGVEARWLRGRARRREVCGCGPECVVVSPPVPRQQAELYSSHEAERVQVTLVASDSPVQTSRCPLHSCPLHGCAMRGGGTRTASVTGFELTDRMTSGDSFAIDDRRAYRLIGRAKTVRVLDRDQGPVDELAREHDATFPGSQHRLAHRARQIHSTMARAVRVGRWYERARGARRMKRPFEPRPELATGRRPGLLFRGICRTGRRACASSDQSLATQSRVDWPDTGAPGSQSDASENDRARSLTQPDPHALNSAHRLPMRNRVTSANCGQPSFLWITDGPVGDLAPVQYTCRAASTSVASPYRTNRFEWGPRRTNRLRVPA